MPIMLMIKHFSLIIFIDGVLDFIFCLTPFKPKQRPVKLEILLPFS